MRRRLSVSLIMLGLAIPGNRAEARTFNIFDQGGGRESAGTQPMAHGQRSATHLPSRRRAAAEPTPTPTPTPAPTPAPVPTGAVPVALGSPVSPPASATAAPETGGFRAYPETVPVDVAVELGLGDGAMDDPDLPPPPKRPRVIKRVQASLDDTAMGMAILPSTGAPAAPPLSGAPMGARWTRESRSAPAMTFRAPPSGAFEIAQTPEGGAPGFEPGVAASDAEPSAPGGGEKVKIDFKDTDIRQVIQIIYDRLGINYMIDDQVKGTVTLLGPQEFSLDEADFMLKSILEIYDYGVQEVDGVHRIIPKKAAAGELIDLRFEVPADHRTPGRLAEPQKLFVQFYKIHNLPAAEIQKVVVALTGGAGAVIPYPPTNSLIIIDSEATLRHISRIVDELDRQVEGRVVIPIRLNHTQAAKVVEKVTEILAKQKEGKPELGTLDEKLAQPILLAESTTNSVLVIAQESVVKGVVDLIELVDTAEIYTPLIRIIHLQNAEAEALAQQVGEAFKAPGEQEAGYRIQADARTQSLIVTATSESMMAKLEELIQFLDGSAVPSGGVTIHHYPMKFSDAKKVSETLSTSLGEAQEGQPPVKIIADENTNSLVVLASKAKYQELLQLLENLDALRPQVMLEALVVDLAMDKNQNIGADLNIIPIEDNQSSGFFLGSTGAVRTGLLGGPSPGAHIGVLSGDFDASELTSTNPDLEELSKITYLINLFKSNSRAKILQAPRLVTGDNVEAKINVGEKVQVPTGLSLVQQPGQVPFTQFATEELGLLLEVTPRITKNDYVSLKINIELKNRTGDVLNFGQFQTPVFTKTGVATEVTIKDNTTLVIGGLIREDKEKQIQKIPLLGDIPFLGRLFQNRSTQTIKRDLMLFMTATIIRDAFAAKRVTAKEESVLNTRELGSHEYPKEIGKRVTAKTVQRDLLQNQGMLPEERE